MKRLFLIFYLVLGGFLQVNGQPEPPDRKGKFFLVPEFWLSLGSVTYIEISPMAGYHVNDRLSMGLGPHYIYQAWKATPYLSAFQTHVWGVKGFARFAVITHAEEFLPINLFNDLFVHMEYEGMSLENGVYDTIGTNRRYLKHLFLVGGGLNQRIGMYNSVSLMILWNLDESAGSPYSNPIFRIGFNVYF